MKAPSSITRSLPAPAYLLAPADVLSGFKVRADRGRKSVEVVRRQATDGRNEIPRHRKHSLSANIFKRLWDSLILLLLTAAGISFWLGEHIDAYIILAAVAIDVVVSFIQTWRTQRVLERLQQHVQQMATVRRDGRTRLIPASQLVTGDIILFRAGSKIPADARLLSAHNVTVHEAALTGEVVDTTKTVSRLTKRSTLAGQHCMIFMGTTVMTGDGEAIVTAIGIQTELGKIAQALRVQHPRATPLRQHLQILGARLAWILSILVGIIMIGNIWRGVPLSLSAREAVTLIVSALPEDLTVVLVIVLTVSMVRILRQRGLVRELASAETLGTATVICTDKTGTLTEGNMTASMFADLQGGIVDSTTTTLSGLHTLAVEALALTADVQLLDTRQAQPTYQGSATSRAAVYFAESLGFNRQRSQDTWRQRGDLPFDVVRKYRATLHDHPTKKHQVLFVAGAPEVLVSRSSHHSDELGVSVPFSSQARAKIMQDMAQLARSGVRLLGVAVKRNVETKTVVDSDVHELLFLGVLVIEDPVRQGVAAAIRTAQEMGVTVKIITGDHEYTARAVAQAVGLSVAHDAVLDGSMVETMNDDELARRVNSITVFSRVEPLDKQRIVRALQRTGQVVAMTGDGVNDAVALQIADIGVAMGSGKDIAKDAADLILLDDDFRTIIIAIREGRIARDNIRKVIAFLLATNSAEVLIFIGSLLLGLPLPLLPAQVLWINLVTDGTADLALALEPEEKNVLQRRPSEQENRLLTGRTSWHIIFSGLVITLCALTLYSWLYYVQAADITYARTMVFSFLAITSLLSTWSYRSLTRSLWGGAILSNRWLLLSTLFSIGLQLIVIYVPRLQHYFSTVPLSVADWGWIVMIAIITVVVIDLRKRFWPIVSS